MSAHVIAFYHTLALLGGGFVLITGACLFVLLFRPERKPKPEVKQCYSPHCHCDFQPGSCRQTQAPR